MFALFADLRLKKRLLEPALYAGRRDQCLKRLIKAKQHISKELFLLVDSPFHQKTIEKEGNRGEKSPHFLF